MYFITNSDGYIIATSKELLESIGSRDICSISSAINSKQFGFNEELKEIKISDTTYLYSKAEMLSAFGNLYLYNLTLKSNLAIDEDDGVAYLKRIKEDNKKRDDNNFNIPSIVIDDNQKDVASNSLEQDIEKNLEENIENNLEESIKNDLEDNIEILKDNKENEVVLELKDENIETKEASIQFSNLELSEEKTQNSQESLEFTEDALTTDSQDLKEELNSDVASLLKDIEEIEVKPLEESKNKDVNEENIGEVKSLADNNVDDSNIPKISNETENKRSGTLSKIKSKLFPWSSNKENEELDNKIELEDEGIESINKEEFNLKDGIEDKTEENLNKTEDNIKALKESQENKFDLELKDENLETKEASLQFSSLELSEEKTQYSQESLETELDKKHLEENIDFKQDSKGELATIDELAPLKEIDEDKKEQDEIITLKNILQDEEQNIVEKSNEENTNTSNKTLMHKLITMQVESIDLEENANKLSINLDNYKLLLENFLEELENYKSDLENGSSSTISMLIDASELLSLDNITAKLKKLSSENNNSIIEELELTKELLRDKLNNKIIKIDESDTNISSEESLVVRDDFISDDKEQEVLITQTENVELNEKADIIDIDSNQENSTPPLPQEAIDITTAKDLLDKINLKKIEFDPDKAVNELNLPKTLILEFVNDFISQAKDHLEQLVDSYKEGDIKTLQTTAHMLKGAASNLRLDPIAEILFKIQKSNNIEDSGELLKSFVSNLKGLEVEVENLEKDSDED